MIAVDKLALVLWDYHHLNHRLNKSDLIFALGSHDLRVATRTAELYLQGYAPLILFSGNEGAGRDISGFAGVPEAIHFKNEAIRVGVPADKIIIETSATNTGENISNSHELLGSLGLHPKSVIAVQKPYMERRTYATLKAQWPAPQPNFLVTSQQVSFSDYIADPKYSKEYTLNMMVGDLQRIIEYPKQGWQIPQEVPSEVMLAYQELIAAGYDKHLIR